MKSKEAVVALFALAQESRLAVFRLLVKRGPQGYTPSELAERLALPAPTLSFHLKELGRAKLIAARRAGRSLHYSVNFARMNSLLDYLSEHCCSLSDNPGDTAGDADCGTVCPPTRSKPTAKK